MDIKNKIKHYIPLIECLKETNIRFINESVGVYDGLHYINQQIIDYVDTYIKSVYDDILSKNKSINIIIPEDIFDLDRIFFTDCEIKIEMLLYNETLPLKRTKDLVSEYQDYNSRLTTVTDKNGETTQKLTDGKFIFRISEMEMDWKDELSTLIYHEFTHAYQDYNCLLTNQNYKEGENYLKNRILYYNTERRVEDVINNPQKYKDYGKNGELIIDCANVMYAINKLEQGAYIAQAYEEIKEYVLNSGIKFTYEDCIANTRVYKDIVNLDNVLKRFSKATPDEVTVIGYTIASFKNIYGHKIKEKQCLKEYKWIIIQIERAINKVYSKVTRLLGDYLSKRNLAGLHGPLRPWISYPYNKTK